MTIATTKLHLELGVFAVSTANSTHLLDCAFLVLSPPAGHLMKSMTGCLGDSEHLVFLDLARADAALAPAASET